MIRWSCACVIVASLLIHPFTARADGPRDNVPGSVRPIPPVGNDLEPADREDLQAGVDALARRIEALRVELKDKPGLLKFLPDVQIYEKAVRWPLEYHETIEPGMARKALADGTERARLLAEGKTSWVNQTGPRGYVSTIDGSIQPYALSVPAQYRDASRRLKPFRIDVWGHGRDEMLTELRFVEQDDYLHELKYLHQPQEPADRFVLSLYGRYLTAYKFAGEIDGLEALAAVESTYPIDPDRRVVIGFSMGGAMAWEYAVHYTDLWAAASPGAGFSETPEFLKQFQKEDVSATPWFQQALWHLYDCTDYVANLTELPTIAYAGELDPQKQASDVMLRAAKAENVRIDRIVGQKIGHHYTPAAKRELDERLDAIVARGRDRTPEAIRFNTWTLRYNHLDWLRVDALERHWKRADVDARVAREGESAAGFVLKTQNVDGLTLEFPAKRCPVKPGATPAVVIDGSNVSAPPAAPDGSWTASYSKSAGKWRQSIVSPSGAELRKRHELQGPIDDAFMSRFVIVRPTGKPLVEKTGKWIDAECEHAIAEWRRQFRGDAIVKTDRQITDEDVATSNLVLFGDPSSNSVLARIARELPIAWDEKEVKLGTRTFDAGRHVPALIYPNPLHPDHYVVLNSGFTYREYDYLNNARQTPKLPDYAVLNVDVPRTSQSPAGITAAGFFDEAWKLQPDDGRGSVSAGEGVK